MLHNSTQPLVHLPRHPSATPKRDEPLPRGECGFIEVQGGAKKRCLCRSFFVDQPAFPTRCGCGHQAWHHEAQPLQYVSLEEHMRVVDELKRLRKEFDTERAYREEKERIWKQIEHRLYENMRLMKIHFDDKVEEAIDRNHALAEKLQSVEDATMELENKLEKHDLGRGLLSRSLTPVLEKSMEPAITELPIRTEKPFQQSWRIKVVVVPQRAQNWAYDPDSVGFQRCKSRNLHQDLVIPNHSSEAFVSAVESAFKGVFKGRPWMPLCAHRPPDDHWSRMALKQLPTDQWCPPFWDYGFLHEHCIVHDKLLGNVLYIALQAEDLSWSEIKYLTMAFGSDESCWAHNDDIDGQQNFKKSLDSDVMYDYSPEPPPYSLSRTHHDMDRMHSRHEALELLASASLTMEAARQQSMFSSERTMTIVSDRSITAASDSSFQTSSATSYDGDDYDEHKDKRPRYVRPQTSQPSLRGTAHPAASPGPIYVSSRSKRKAPVRPPKPPREPGEGPSSGNRFRMNNIFHRHEKRTSEGPVAASSATAETPAS